MFFLLYHCGENTNVLVLANMVSPMKVRPAGLRRRELKAKWTMDAFTDSRESRHSRCDANRQSNSFVLVG